MHTTPGTERAADAPERPDAPAPGAARPVFVDASGRRQRRVRRLGRLLVIPAAAYVGLLLSTALGGPTVSSPYLPLPEAPGAGHQAGTVRPDGSPTRTAGADPAKRAHRTPAAGTRTSAATAVGTGTAPSGSTAPGTPRPSLSPTATAPATTPTARPTPTVTHGKSTASHPVPTHTGHGNV